ncbi:MAG: LacI family DNA-binding transcriptional regulator [Sphaerochaetaceae bacterium]
MATIRDVSKETGLSVGTVSRVLNNRGYISQETKNKVAQAMRKLNYQPNELARSLSKSKSSILGVIIPSLRHPYFANLVSFIEEEAGRNGYQILLFQSNDKREKESMMLEECTKNRVAGIILCSGQFSIVKLKGLEIPVVTIERMQEHASASIECDNLTGGRLAAECLIRKGCTFLLHVSNVQGNEMPADKRTIGFVEACEKAHMQHREIPFSEALYESMDYHDFLSKLLDTFPQADGIFCSSDIAAAQVLQICNERNITIPGKMKVIGFDDIPLAEMTSPQLTTIHQPIKEMADMAVTMLIDAKERKVASVITMAVSLRERKST